MEQGFSPSDAVMLSRRVLRQRKQKKQLHSNKGQSVVEGNKRGTGKDPGTASISAAGHFHLAPAQLTRVTSGPDITKCIILVLLISYLNHLSALHFLAHSLVCIPKSPF